MDQLSALRIFTRVAESGSFSSAARHLNLSKSAVSKQVSALEDHLGAKLLYRTTRQVSLTPEGRAYVERILPILDELHDADQSVRQAKVEPRGTLRVNAPLGFGYRHIAPLLAAFQHRFPRLLLDLDLTDRFVDLVEEGYDVCIRIADQLEDSSLIARRLATVDLLMVAAPAYCERHGVPVEPADLQTHRCLRYRGRRGLHEWPLEARDGRRTVVRVKGPFISNNGEALRQAAVDAMGIARLPAFTISEDLAAGRLRPVMADWSPPQLSIHALYPANRHLSAKVRAFVDFLAADFRSDPSWNAACRRSADQATTPARRKAAS
ncbi:MAG: LysR family transcriptional regulator [Rhodothalassiaceae bacterium]